MSDVDLWDDDVLADPYPTFAEMRAAGPVVWLEQHGLAALPRYAEVAAALADWRRFSSAQGVGVDDEMNAAMGENPIASDPPVHDTYRKPLVEQLSPAALAEIGPHVGELAVRYAEAAVRAESFDAVTDLARPYSLNVVGDLVGLRPDDREGYPELAERAFNVFGPAGHRTVDGFVAAGELIQRTLAVAEPGRLLPGGRGEELCRLGVPILLVPYTWPGIDTTVNALASAVLLFARHPDQWDELRADRSLIPSAFNEVLRLHAPVHYFTRHTTEDIDVAGVALSAGTKVLLMYGSANRDERRFTDPDRFDIHRRADGHLAFGRGVHLCAGIHLARLEGHALLDALADRVVRFERAGEPRWTPNNTLHGLGALAVRVTPAQ